jgi:hypothetical protein
VDNAFSSNCKHVIKKKGNGFLLFDDQPTIMISNIGVHLLQVGKNIPFSNGGLKHALFQIVLPYDPAILACCI